MYYYCFGLLHGQDRAWQMDYFKRTAQGRVAEVNGIRSLKNDLMLRLLDLNSHAQRIYEELDSEKKEILKNYSKGVNEGFKIGKNSKEFMLKKYEPEEWKPYHSILVLLLQSFDQTKKTFASEIFEQKFAKTWKEDSLEIFDESKAPWFSSIMKEGEYQKTNEKKVVQGSPYPVTLWHDFPEVFGKESGSNNWVVDKKHSQSGHALFANDPHLDIRTPLFWYFLNLKGPEFEVLGGSLPGVPLIASGTNMNVAWGLTNSYANTANLFELPSAQKLQSFRPIVYFKFWFFKIPFFFKSFMKTEKSYPIIPLEGEDKIVGLNWSGYALKGSDVSPIFDIPKAKTSKEIKKILGKVGLSSWNYVFADTKGEIGYQVVGKVFKETNEAPWGIRKGKSSDVHATHFLSADEVPNLLNPKRGYIYTANNRHWPSDSYFKGGRGYSSSFRGFRIDEMLKEKKHDFNSFKEIQCDVKAIDAQFFIPLLNQKIKIPELMNWNFIVDHKKDETTLYRFFMEKALKEWNVNEEAFYYLLKNTTRIGLKRLQDIYDEVVFKYKGVAWENKHRISFKHLSQEDWKFAPELSGVGDRHTVNPGTMKWDEERGLFEHHSGASMRFIIEMKVPVEIHLSMPGMNRNYDVDFEKSRNWQDWASCRFTKIQ